MRSILALDEALVEAFAGATGDRSAIHLDAAFARRTRFRRPIVHGLLPVLATLRGVSNRSTPNSLWLQSLSCRFLAPAHAGERLLLTSSAAANEAGAVRYGFRITNEQTGIAVTEGEAVFGTGAARTSPSARGVLLCEAAVEDELEAASLTPGRSEGLAFHAAPAGIRNLLNAIDARSEPAATADESSLDPNLTAILPVSTLVGMRLPGRFATFMEFDVTFERPIEADSPMELMGRVERMTPGANRLQLALTWTHSGAVVASGSASALVSTRTPVGISCEEIRSQHLSSGLAGRVALVTGASRGIGEATVKLLAMQGAKVAVHYFRGGADAADIVDDIRRNGGAAFAVSADLRREADIDAMFATVRNELGEVDILVNNAVGDASPKAFADLTSRDYLGEMEISLFGLHACCRRALPHMRAQRRGKIVNVGTPWTEKPEAGQSVYITAKSAVVGYTRSLAQDLARENLQVNMVLPRMTDTSLIASLPPVLRGRIESESPTGALLQPIDVARVVAFLASDAASSISGQRIVLSQGEAPFL